MAHFAKVNNGIVEKVIVAEQDFIDSLQDATSWIQTSYNTKGGIHYNPETREPSSDQSKAFRKNYAGLGFTYDETRDAFIAPQPYPSWTLNEESCLWESPVAYPTDGEMYTWKEETQTWDLVAG